MKLSDTYFANNIPSDYESVSASKWISLLLAKDNDLEERVRKDVNQWNIPIRDLLRNETGLRFSSNADAAKNRSNPSGVTKTQVPVKVVDGIPVSLVKVLAQYDEYADLLLDSAKVLSTQEGLKILGENYEDWRRFSPNKAVPREAITDISTWLDDIREDIEILQFDESFRGIGEDFLGAYFFHESRIEIYWAAIGIVAKILNIPVSGLTIVVLAHELAHAYTHLGKDIDGEIWKTEHFSRADLFIVEGLAQHFTESVCVKLSPRFPGAAMAFESLLMKQHTVYKDFKDWLPGKNLKGEIIRYTMIQSRTKSITNYSQFINTLAQVDQLDLG